MGPFELMDLIGVDVKLLLHHALCTKPTFGEARFRPNLLQQRAVDSGRLGPQDRDAVGIVMMRRATQ